MTRRPRWCTKQKQTVARVLHNDRAKFPKDFSVIVHYTNMAAIRAGARCKPRINLNVLTKEVLIREECVLLIVTLAYMDKKNATSNSRNRS